MRDILQVKGLTDDQELQFDILVHAATVLSTIVILFPMFRRLVAGFFSFKRNDDAIYVWKVLLSCIPVGIVGVCFKHQYEALTEHGGLTLVGICLCVTALLLSFAYFSSFASKGRLRAADSGRNIGWIDAFVIGIAQSIAVLPGLSRSGTTIATGILLGNKRNEVANFSFIMVILPILGESMLDLIKMLKGTSEAASAGSGIGLSSMIIGFLAAFIVGCIACKWMIALVKKGKLIWFAIYCLAIGILCLALA
jgi:undecaprenyl-diphosphatase